MAEHSCGVRSASRRPLQRRGRFASSIALSGVGQSSSLRRTRERRSLYSALFFAAAHGSSSVLMGGRTKAELFWEELFRPHVRAVHATTDDGSYGTEGFVTTLLPELLQEGDYDAVAVCGPPIMMESVAQMAASFGLPCEVSLERRMACGLGACLSCAVDTRGGRRKVCKDGPVFSAEEVYGHVS